MDEPLREARAAERGLLERPGERRDGSLLDPGRRAEDEDDRPARSLLSRRADAGGRSVRSMTTAASRRADGPAGRWIESAPEGWRRTTTKSSPRVLGNDDARRRLLPLRERARAGTSARGRAFRLRRGGRPGSPARPRVAAEPPPSRAAARTALPSRPCPPSIAPRSTNRNAPGVDPFRLRQRPRAARSRERSG